MQSVAILRQHYPIDFDGLRQLAAIADRIEELAEFVDLPGSIPLSEAETGAVSCGDRDSAVKA